MFSDNRDVPGNYHSAKETFQGRGWLSRETKGEYTGCIHITMPAENGHAPFTYLGRNLWAQITLSRFARDLLPEANLMQRCPRGRRIVFPLRQLLTQPESALP